MKKKYYWEIIILIKKYWRDQVFVFCFSLLDLALIYVLPYINVIIIDQGITGKNLKILIVAVVSYLLAIVIKNVFGIYNQQIMLKISQKIKFDLSKKIIQVYLKEKEENLYESHSSLDVILKKDIGKFEKFIVSSPQSILKNIISICIALAIMIRINIYFALIIMILQTISVFIRNWYNHAIEKNNKKSRNLFVHMNRILNEIIFNIKSILFIGGGHYIVEKYSQSVKENNKQEVFAVKTFMVLQSWLAMITESISCIMLLTGGIFVIHQKITLGVLLGALQYAGNYGSSLQKVYSITSDISNNRVEVENIAEIFRVLRNSKDKPIRNVYGKNIHLNHVTFGYKIDENVLCDVSLYLSQGNIYYLIGESGKGKTTLVKLIMGEYGVSSGKILIDGININKICKEQLSQLITWVPNEPVLFHDTIYQNITLNNNYKERDIVEVCKDCAIYDDIKNMNNGFEAVLDENGSDLSAGQRQRLGIVRALLSKNPIIIFDEMTANLDSITETKIKKCIEKYSKDRIIIIITHSKEFILEKAIVFEVQQKSIYKKEGWK